MSTSSSRTPASRPQPLLDMSDADWHDQIDVNLSGTANVLRVFAPLLVRRGGGRIIVTSSTQGQHGTKFGSAYSASKWGIIGLIKSAALEFGVHNITVNAVIPGLIDTALTRHEDRYAQVIAEAGATASGDPAQDERKAIELLKEKTPLGVPWLAPEQVAPLVVFLASDQAAMVSGTSQRPQVTARTSQREPGSTKAQHFSPRFEGVTRCQTFP